MKSVGGLPRCPLGGSLTHPTKAAQFTLLTNWTATQRPKADVLDLKYGFWSKDRSQFFFSVFKMASSCCMIKHSLGCFSVLMYTCYFSTEENMSYACLKRITSHHNVCCLLMFGLQLASCCEAPITFYCETLAQQRVDCNLCSAVEFKTAVAAFTCSSMCFFFVCIVLA